jgi:hypothetical protein
MGIATYRRRCGRNVGTPCIRRKWSECYSLQTEVTLAQLDLCLGPGCLDRDRICERGYYVRYDDDWRRHGDNCATIEAEPVVTWRFANGAATRS